MSVTATLTGVVLRARPVGGAPPPSGEEQTFDEWLASTNGSNGPLRRWKFADASGTTMLATTGGINGTWVNPANMTFEITDSDNEKWIGLQPNAGVATAYGTIASPLSSQAFTALILFQSDEAGQGNRTLLQMNAADTAGEFRVRIAQDGVGGYKPVVWSVDAGNALVELVGSDNGTIPDRMSGALFYVRGSDGSQKLYIGSTQIALTLQQGTIPGSWPAVPSGTLFVGTRANLNSSWDGVLRELVLWDVALTPSDIQGIAQVVPSTPKRVVWLGDFEAPSIEVGQTSLIDLYDHAHPSEGFVPAIVPPQPTLGVVSVSGEQIQYEAASTTGNNNPFTANISFGGLTSRTATITIDVVEAAATADVHYFGQYYGAGDVGRQVGDTEMHQTNPMNCSYFFRAERTGRIDRMRLQVRSGANYSKGNLGTYTISIFPASGSTKRPTTTASADAISRITGYGPNNNVFFEGQRFEEIEFTQKGTVTAGNPYCLCIQNTHSNPSGNYYAMNQNKFIGFNSTPSPNYTEPASGGGVGDILVASGGIDPGNVSTSVARIAGWTPVKINGNRWHPHPIFFYAGDFMHERIGGPLAEFVYSDNEVTNWGVNGGEENWWSPVAGQDQFRQRFRVSRANRVVSGVFIRGWISASGGNLLVRLEHGPQTDSHTPGNGTLMGSEISVDADMFLNCGTDPPFGGGWEHNQNRSKSDTGELEIPHWVWVPFGQNHTLVQGQIYNLRLRPSGCTFRINSSGRSDGRFPGSPGGNADGKSTSTWDAWEANRGVPWDMWEDSRGPQESSDGGNTWSYASGDLPPIVFKCV